MPEPHKVDWIEAKKWQYESVSFITFASQACQGINKKIGVNLRGEWVVYNHNELVYTTSSVIGAVEKYNSLK